MRKFNTNTTFAALFLLVTIGYAYVWFAPKNVADTTTSDEIIITTMIVPTATSYTPTTTIKKICPTLTPLAQDTMEAPKRLAQDETDASNRLAPLATDIAKRHAPLATDIAKQRHFQAKCIDGQWLDPTPWGFGSGISLTRTPAPLLSTFQNMPRPQQRGTARLIGWIVLGIIVSIITYFLKNKW